MEASNARLNWGCGEHTAPGWINSDRKSGPNIDLEADILRGLPLDDESIDYAVSIHALPELALPDIQPTLTELYRVLKPGGVLRLGLPDLGKGIRAYLRREDDYFTVDDEIQSAGGRFIVHMLWYGYTRTLFTFDFAAELLGKAGFVEIAQCEIGRTASAFGAITELDNRPRESFFIEGTKPTSPQSATPATDQPSDPTSMQIEVLEVTAAPRDAALRGSHLDHPRGGLVLDSRSMLVAGWVLGDPCPAARVELISGGTIVAESPVSVQRPDLVEAFPALPAAGTAGFLISMEAEGFGRATIDVVAVLEDGTRASIGAIRVVTKPAVA